MAVVRKLTPILCFLALLVPATGAVASPPRRFEFREVHMGTEFKLILYTNAEDSARRASQVAFLRAGNSTRRSATTTPTAN